MVQSIQDTRLRITKQDPNLSTLSDATMSHLGQDGQTWIISDLDQDILVNVPHENLHLDVFPRYSDTVCQYSYMYNKNGAKFLAKSALCSIPQTQAMSQENRRLYQGQKIESYMLPCDETEQDRLDFFHAVFIAALRSTQLIHVPHTSNGCFLNLGCGTGIWAIEMAKAYPDAYVLGVDTSVIQPQIRPFNCVIKTPFNYELPWLIGEGQWDIIHMRMGCGSVVSWPNLYKRIFNHLRCGAWFEQLEIDFRPRCNTQSQEQTSLSFWYQCLKAATEHSKRSIAHSPEQTLHWLQEAGFSDICHEEVVLPLNPWKQPVRDRHVARWYSTAFVESIEPLCMAPFHRVYGWDYKKIQSTVAAAVAEVLDPDLNAFHTLHVYKARKSSRMMKA